MAKKMGLDKLLKEAEKEQEEVGFGEVLKGINKIASMEQDIEKVGGMVVKGIETVVPQQDLDEIQQRQRWIWLIGVSFLAGLGIGWLWGKGQIKL